MSFTIISGNKPSPVTLLQNHTIKEFIETYEMLKQIYLIKHNVEIPGNVGKIINRNILKH